MEHSGFFPSYNGDREYDYEFLARFMGSLIGNGVYNGECAVQLENHNVVISAGRAWINGYFYISDASVTLPLEAEENYARVDNVILRWNKPARTVSAMIAKGNPREGALPPTRTGDIYDLVLARVSVRKGWSSLYLTDTRYDPQLCGVTVGPANQIDSASLHEQIDKLANIYENWYKVLSAHTNTYSGIQDVYSQMIALIPLFVSDLRLDHTISHNTGGTSGIEAAATDRQGRWYMVEPITKNFFYTDDLQNFHQGDLPQFHNIEGMATNESQLCVLRPKEVSISEDRGQSFVTAAIPEGLTDANAFIGLRSYRKGFIAIANYFAACDSVYIEYFGGKWTFRSIGKYGKTRDIIACGDKLVRACSAHLDDGSVAFTGIRIQDSLDGPDTDITIPDAHIPLKLGWDGKGISVICADGYTFYTDDFQTLRETGNIHASLQDMGDIVCSCGVCAAALGSDSILVSIAGEEWRVMSMGTGVSYQAVAAHGGSFLFAGSAGQAVCTLETSGEKYARELAGLAQTQKEITAWFEENKETFQQTIGRRILLQKDSDPLPETLEEGHILLVYQDVSPYSEGTEGAE